VPDTRAVEQSTLRPGSSNSSLLRNNFCNIAGQKTLRGRIGISMAVIKEVTPGARNFANATTLLLGMPVPAQMRG
jgi:hypothetical protein